jgi:sec-independent protein translocase protein TatA
LQRAGIRILKFCSIFASGKSLFGMLLFISGQEIVIIALVVLLLFGSQKLPEMARGLGKGMREFRKAADDIKRELSESAPDIKKDLKDIGDNIKGSMNDLTDDLKKFKDDID